jgi:hypothetical protein
MSYNGYMPEIVITRLIWEERNLTHIWDRHQMTQELVEGACYGNPEDLYIEDSYGNRQVILAPAQSGLLLFVVVSSSYKGTPTDQAPITL